MKYSRGKKLSQLIEECLCLDNFIRDENLIVALKGTSTLPIRALLQHPMLYVHRPSEGDIIAACSEVSNYELKIVRCPDSCIILPFYVDLEVLVMSNLPDAKQSEFREFMVSILGHKNFEVHPFCRGSFKTRFADRTTALCVFNAMKYCSFKGQHVVATPHSSLTPMTEKPPLQPVPVHKTRSQQRKQKKQREREAQKQANIKTPLESQHMNHIPHVQSELDHMRRR